MAVSVKALFACHTAIPRKGGGFQVRTHLLLQNYFFFSIPRITYGNLGKSWLADVQVNFCGHGVGLS